MKKLIAWILAIVIIVGSALATFILSQKGSADFLGLEKLNPNYIVQTIDAELVKRNGPVRIQELMDRLLGVCGFENGTQNLDIYSNKSWRAWRLVNFPYGVFVRAPQSNSFLSSLLCGREKTSRLIPGNSAIFTIKRSFYEDLEFYPVQGSFTFEMKQNGKISIIIGNKNLIISARSEAKIELVSVSGANNQSQINLFMESGADLSFSCKGCTIGTDDKIQHLISIPVPVSGNYFYEGNRLEAAKNYYIN